MNSPNLFFAVVTIFCVITFFANFTWWVFATPFLTLLFGFKLFILMFVCFVLSEVCNTNMTDEDEDNIYYH